MIIMTNRQFRARLALAETEGAGSTLLSLQAALVDRANTTGSPLLGLEDLKAVFRAEVDRIEQDGQTAGPEGPE